MVRFRNQLLGKYKFTNLSMLACYANMGFILPILEQVPGLAASGTSDQPERLLLMPGRVGFPCFTNVRSWLRLQLVDATPKLLV